VDMTSIVPNNAPLLWKAHQQYMNFFYYPLLLHSNNKGKWVRYSLQDPIGGISAIDTFNLVDAKLLFSRPGEYLKLALENRLYKYFETKQEMKVKLRQEISKRAQKKPPVAMQIRYNQGLLKKVSQFQFHNENDAWAAYYSYQDKDCEPEKKIQYVENILKDLGHKTLLDLGCNTGRFSILAAKNGYKVTSVDGSEKCVESLYAYAKKNQLDILPLVSDLSNPVPGYGFQSKQFSGLLERAQSDVVLCLGLMHHLHINGRQPFEKIAEMLSSVARKALVFEYVDKDDANNKLLDQGREINYNIDIVKKALNKFFEIQEFESDRETRKILVCKKK
jgi:SAM-dependent methyltransferase